jgi:malonate decarboxylase gamma subunit
VVALLVGRAMSGAFLAHGYQANRLLALDAPGVLVHAMGREAAARITRRPLAELDEMGEKIPPMSYDIRNYARLGLLHKLIPGIDADAPSATQLDQVRASLVAAIADIRASGRCDLACRLRPGLRAASIDVRQRLAQEWR